MTSRTAGAPKVLMMTDNSPGVFILLEVVRVTSHFQSGNFSNFSLGSSPRALLQVAPGTVEGAEGTEVPFYAKQTSGL